MTRGCKPDLLSRYLDAEMPAAQSATMRDHLRGCQSCRREVQRLRSNDRALASLRDDRMAISPELDRRITQSIATRRPLGPIAALNRLMPAAVGTGVAAVLVLLSVNFGLYGHTQMTNDGPSSTGTVSFQQQSTPLLRVRRSTAVLGVRPQPANAFDVRGKALFNLN